jgi:hypothetical protein
LKSQKGSLRLQKPIKDPAKLEWHEVNKVSHHWLEVDAETQPMQVREEERAYGDRGNLDTG